MPRSYNYANKPPQPRGRGEKREFYGRSPNRGEGGTFVPGRSSGNLGLMIAVFGVTIFSLLAIVAILIYSATMGSP